MSVLPVQTRAARMRSDAAPIAKTMLLLSERLVSMACSAVVSMPRSGPGCGTACMSTSTRERMSADIRARLCGLPAPLDCDEDSPRHLIHDGTHHPAPRQRGRGLRSCRDRAQMAD